MDNYFLSKARNMCTAILTVSSLLHEITEPVGYPDLPQFRLVDMFSSGAHPSVKEIITSSFTKPASVLRVLIATVAFGLGVNPPDVRYILHCGPPHDIETYVQEVGRGGRDGGLTYATIFILLLLNVMSITT